MTAVSYTHLDVYKRQLPANPPALPGGQDRHIPQDFHDRPDLTPNLCALFVEEAWRCLLYTSRCV